MRLNYDLDVRHVLPVIQAPTLVLHRVADSLVPSDCGRYLAENITDAKFVGMPGTDHSIVDSDTQDFVADKIEEFITGERQVHEPDRMLAPVMFTDMVGSTQQAADMGESRWHAFLYDSHAVMSKTFAGHASS